MAKARAEELEFMDTLGVWKVVDRNEAFFRTGRLPISVRWVNVNKGDTLKPKVRCRVVVQETKRVSRHMTPAEVFSATPPLEFVKCLLSSCASSQWTRRPTRLLVVDVKK